MQVEMSRPDVPIKVLWGSEHAAGFGSPRGRRDSTGRGCQQASVTDASAPRGQGFADVSLSAKPSAGCDVASKAARRSRRGEAGAARARGSQGAGHGARPSAGRSQRVAAVPRARRRLRVCRVLPRTPSRASSPHLLGAETRHLSSTVRDGDTGVQRRLLEDLRPLSGWTACRNTFCLATSKGTDLCPPDNGGAGHPCPNAAHSASSRRVHPGLQWKVKHLFHCSRI